MGAAWLWGREDTVGTLTTGCWLVTKITGHSSVRVKMGLQWRVHYSGTGCKPKENKNNQYRNQKSWDHSCWGGPPHTPTGRPPVSDIFVHQQRLGGGRAAAHGVDPHRMVHHRPLLVGAAVR